VSSNLVDALQALILFCIAANFVSSLKLRLPALRQMPPSKSKEAPGVAVVATDTEPSATPNVKETT